MIMAAAALFRARVARVLPLHRHCPAAVAVERGLLGRGLTSRECRAYSVTPYSSRSGKCKRLGCIALATPTNLLCDVHVALTHHTYQPAV